LNTRQVRNLFRNVYSPCPNQLSYEYSSRNTVRGKIERWGDGHFPSYAEAKKNKSLTMTASQGLLWGLHFLFSYRTSFFFKCTCRPCTTSTVSTLTDLSRWIFATAYTIFAFTAARCISTPVRQRLLTSVSQVLDNKWRLKYILQKQVACLILRPRPPHLKSWYDRITRLLSTVMYYLDA